MAANATRMLYINLPFETVYPVIGMALTNIGATLKNVDPNTGRFFATRGFSLTSYGENITIQPYRTPTGCSLDVKSECSVPTVIIDWGKNTENITKLAFELSRILQVPVA
jgi:hypothetical protein